MGSRFGKTSHDHPVFHFDAIGKGLGAVSIRCSAVHPRSERADAVSTASPIHHDLDPRSLRTFLLDSLMTRVSELFQDFQDLDGPIPTAGMSPESLAQQKDAAFQALFAIDDELNEYLNNLPNIFSVNPVHINYATESRYPRLKVYRQIIIGSVYFIRILLHRPFMLNSRRFGEAEGPYRTCWRRCVDTAIRDLRLRNMWRLTLSDTEQVSPRVDSIARAQVHF